jgi:hypothetical protein
MAMTRGANLQARQQDLVFWSHSQTTDGRRVALGPVVKLSARATDEELVDAIRTVLDGSQTGVEPPNPFLGLKSVLAVAGATSERAFNKGARSVGIQEDSKGTILLNPRKPDGGGWMGMNDEVISLDNPTPEELANAVRRAVEVSIPRV